MLSWKKRTKYTSLLLTAAALLAACAGDDVPDMEQGAQAEGDETGSTPDISEGDSSTLMVGMTNAPDSFNPFYRPGVAATWIQRFFYDSLLFMPTADSFEPGLAEMTTEDNQVFTVKINADANWSDGTPVTSEDVAYTLNTIADPEVETTLGTSVAMIEGADASGVREDGLEELSGLEIVDEKTLTITTKKPVDLNYISEFLGLNVLIAPKHIFEEIELSELPNSEAATKPSVFSGAYEFIEYDNNNYVHLEANPDYYRGEPEIKTVYAQIMNGTSLITEFQAGNLHMTAGGGIGMVPVQDVGLLEDLEDVVLEEHASFNGQYMIINNEKYEDPQVRRAFAHAIDRETIVENLLGGRGEVLASPYSSASPYKDTDVEPLEYNPELAKELLEDAGFDFDTPIEFVVPTGNAVREQSGNLIEQWLEEIGLTVNQSNYDFPTWLSMAQDLDYDIGLMGWGHTADPNLASYFQTGGASNNMGLSDPVIDELLEQGMSETEYDSRFAVYSDLQKHLQEEMPVVPLYSDSQFSVQSDSLNGGIKEYWAGSLHDLIDWTIDSE